MKRLGLALLFFATNAGASPSTIEDLPFAPTAATIATGPVNAPFPGACILTTVDERGIKLRWIPDESAIERTTCSTFRKDEKGNLVRENPEWSYEPTIRWEGVTKVTPVKIASSGDVAVWAWREANAVILVVPTKSGITTSTDQHSGAVCSMAMMALSAKPASECKTTAGCGRFGKIGGNGYEVTAGVMEGKVSARLRVFLPSP